MITGKQVVFWGSLGAFGLLWLAIRERRESVALESSFPPLPDLPPPEPGAATTDLDALPPDGWWRGRSPKEIKFQRIPAERVCYRAKRDALAAFMSHNQGVIDNFGGEDAVHTPAEFDAVNVKLGLRGDRRAKTTAQAIWLAMEGPGPWCLENVDVDLLNRTAPGRAHRVGFTLPDAVIEKRNERLERERPPERLPPVPF